MVNSGLCKMARPWFKNLRLPDAMTRDHFKTYRKRFQDRAKHFRVPPLFHFSKFQSLQTYCAAHVKSFDINGDTLLALANYRNGNRAESHKIDSSIYKWNGSNFDLFQSIPTRGAFALHPFFICGQTYLTAVNYYDGEKNVHRYSTTSDVYQFNGEHFIKYQEIPTKAAIAVTKFDFKNQVYLVIVSYYNEIENKYRINSNLFRWI